MNAYDFNLNDSVQRTYGTDKEVGTVEQLDYMQNIVTVWFESLQDVENIHPLGLKKVGN